MFQKYNKDVHYFYYSTNLENIKFNTELSLLEHNFIHLHSWNNYVVWDKYQKKYLEKYLITKPIFSVVGYIDFYNLSSLNLNHSHKFISIFDVSPFREFYINVFYL